MRVDVMQRFPQLLILTLHCATVLCMDPQLYCTLQICC